MAASGAVGRAGGGERWQQNRKNEIDRQASGLNTDPAGAGDVHGDCTFALVSP